jgi:predicted Zn finger-like uncharacterized protein
MAIPFSCPSCAGELKVRDELAGRKVKCPKCGEVIPVPEEESEEEQEQEDRPRKKKKKKRKNKSNTAVIVGIILGVLLVGGGVAIVVAVTGGKKDEPQAKAPPPVEKKEIFKFEKPRKGAKDLISAVARRLEITEVNNWFRQLGISYQTVASASTSGKGPADFKELTELATTASCPLKDWLDKGWIVVVWGARLSSQPDGASNTPLAWETDPDLQGNRVVLLCSGSVQTMPEAEFAKTAKAKGR